MVAQRGQPDTQGSPWESDNQTRGLSGGGGTPWKLWRVGTLPPSLAGRVLAQAQDSEAPSSPGGSAPEQLPTHTARHS